MVSAQIAIRIAATCASHALNARPYARTAAVTATGGTTQTRELRAQRGISRAYHGLKAPLPSPLPAPRGEGEREGHFRPQAAGLGAPSGACVGAFDGG
jgi:hypothetical protein